MPHKSPRVAAALMASAWAIDPVKVRPLRALAMRALAGEEISDQDRVANRVGQGRSASPAKPQGSVAIVPIVGTIVHRVEQADDISGPGGVSAARLRSQIRQLANDDSVGSILLDIESPGGSVDGIAELGQDIRAASMIKPVVASANAYAASAAYWIASQAGEVVITPSGELGSIGVYSLHEDDSQLLETMGVKISVIRAGAHKIEANPFEPLSEEARSDMQATVDRYYEEFTAAVARGRGLSASTVRKEPWGQGRMVGAKRAVEVGLADRVETIEETVARLANGKGVIRQSRNKADMTRLKLGFA